MRGLLNRRMARRQFWICFCITLVIVEITRFALLRLMVMAVGLKGIMLMQPIGALAILPYAILGTWRLHDINKSSWPIWLTAALGVAGPFIMLGAFFAPLALGVPGRTAGPAGLIAGYMSAVPVAGAMLGLACWILYLWCQPGDVGGNRFGPPPDREGPQMPDDGEDGSTTPPGLDFLRPARPATQVTRPMTPPTKSFGKRAH